MRSFEDAVKYNFLYVDKYIFGINWFYKENMIPYSLLRYIIEGSGIFEISGEKLKVEKGQIVYIPERSLLECKSLENKFSFISIRFSTSVFYEGADFLTEYYGIPKLTEGDIELEKYFNDIHDARKEDKSTKLLRMHGNLELIIAKLIEKSGFKRENTKNYMKEYEKKEFSPYEIHRKIKDRNLIEDPRISIVVDYILTHPVKKYTSSLLSEMSGLSETTFRRIFKKQTGKSPNEFIREVRLTATARLLLLTDERINNIAYEVGFEDVNYFIRVFKKSFGMTPGKFRQTAHEYR